MAPTAGEQHAAAAAATAAAAAAAAGSCSSEADCATPSSAATAAASLLAALGELADIQQPSLQEGDSDYELDEYEQLDLGDLFVNTDLREEVQDALARFLRPERVLLRDKLTFVLGIMHMWESASLRDLVWLPLVPYLGWATLYYIKVFVISSKKIQERGYETLFQYSTKSRKSLFGAVVLRAPPRLQPVAYMGATFYFDVFLFKYGLSNESRGANPSTVGLPPKRRADSTVPSGVLHASQSSDAKKTS
ncbi:hypothetical protein CHLNCDRAFT_142708 [Chlorella variabilis]|uniref:Glycerophosphocholine acyltransferase 1 n=1 Tax=Chlorella variabilis TaxID=554065 RepID=E1Z8J1_CHLVA|nr:hypothetical protein CHLNCDRAFT_142708 [Chlorella variabilis]EFN57344.1 hypothetical protein CHLNCDRAFT_142708 [Chlorella variabilis]|eukprot:XP_005849446.1 hypothetical protein CHLNCDRAFT_142708 [Chlorella variabilis]